MAFRKVAEFKECSLQYQSNGPSTFEFFTDMPGGTLAQRVNTALPTSNNARTTTTVPLDGITGTQFYPEIIPGSTTQLRLFSGVVYLRPIGVYIDGSLGEIWSTPPLSIGT